MKTKGCVRRGAGHNSSSKCKVLGIPHRQRIHEVGAVASCGGPSSEEPETTSFHYCGKKKEKISSERTYKGGNTPYMSPFISFNSHFLTPRGLPASLLDEYVIYIN